MGISDEVKNSFGQDFFTRKRERAGYHNWFKICVCGHLDRYHGESIGGAYHVPAPFPRNIGGLEVTVSAILDGCVGAMPDRGFQTETKSMDREAQTQTTVVHPTCPCVEFRPIADIDRPNRYWNQRLPIDRKDHGRHPFLTGLRAFSTHLSKRRAALSNPAWAEQELERRFAWVDGARVCGISRCRETADVWPVFIDEEQSELRCAAHR
jgi:hypothetical protein